MAPSFTARLAAAHRAYHLMHDRPPILEDTEALWLTGPPLSVILRVAPLRWIFWERLLRRVRPLSVFVSLRSRYAEDRLAQAIDDGCRQYVILGAGLDSWALRQAPLGVTVFELDQPETQDWKRERIRTQRGEVPPHLVLTPIDFEHQTISDVLLRSAFDRASLAFVSWLGTIYYLTHETIEASLASLAAVVTPGSRLVFDYFLTRSMMSSEELALFADVDQGGTRRGEPLLTLLEPGEVASMLSKAGWRVVEDLPAPQIREHYLQDRSDGLDIPGFVRLCLAERQFET